MKNNDKTFPEATCEVRAHVLVLLSRLSNHPCSRDCFPITRPPREVSFLVARATFHVSLSSPARFLACRPLFSLLPIILDLSHQGPELLSHGPRVQCYFGLLLLQGPNGLFGVSFLDLDGFYRHLQGPTTQLLLTCVVVRVIGPAGQMPCTISQHLGRLVLPFPELGQLL